MLCDDIKFMEKNIQLFVKNPEKDFTRNRKLPFHQLMKFIIAFEKETISDELFTKKIFLLHRHSASKGLKYCLSVTRTFIQVQQAFQAETLQGIPNPCLLRLEIQTVFERKRQGYIYKAKFQVCDRLQRTPC